MERKSYSHSNLEDTIYMDKGSGWIIIIGMLWSYSTHISISDKSVINNLNIYINIYKHHYNSLSATMDPNWGKQINL